MAGRHVEPPPGSGSGPSPCAGAPALTRAPRRSLSIERELHLPVANDLDRVERSRSDAGDDHPVDARIQLQRVAADLAARDLVAAAIEHGERQFERGCKRVAQVAGVVCAEIASPTQRRPGLELGRQLQIADCEPDDVEVDLEPAVAQAGDDRLGVAAASLLAVRDQDDYPPFAPTSASTAASESAIGVRARFMA